MVEIWMLFSPAVYLKPGLWKWPVTSQHRGNDNSHKESEFPDIDMTPAPQISGS